MKATHTRTHAHSDCRQNANHYYYDCNKQKRKWRNENNIMQLTQSVATITIIMWENLLNVATAKPASEIRPNLMSTQLIIITRRNYETTMTMKYQARNCKTVKRIRFWSYVRSFVSSWQGATMPCESMKNQKKLSHINEMWKSHFICKMHMGTCWGEAQHSVAVCRLPKTKPQDSRRMRDEKWNKINKPLRLTFMKRRRRKK